MSANRSITCGLSLKHVCSRSATRAAAHKPAGREVPFLDLNGYAILVGMTADDAFRFLRQEDVIKQSEKADSEVPESLIVTKLYQVKGVKFEVEFRRTEYISPYYVTKIVVFDSLTAAPDSST